jgi:hypothetical protein
VPVRCTQQIAYFPKEPLRPGWFSDVNCIPQDLFVAQVRLAVPARQEKWDGHRSKHFRDGRDTFPGEIHIKNRHVGAHLLKQSERHGDTGGGHHLIARTPKRLLELQGYQKLILYD